MKRSAIMIALVSAGILSPLAVQANSFKAAQNIEKSFKSKAAYADNQLLLKFSKDATPAQRASILRQLGVDTPTKTVFKGSAGAESVQLVNLKGISVKDAVKLLSGVTAVAAAEPNWKIKVAALNDPAVPGSAWGLHGPESDENSDPDYINEFGTNAVKSFRETPGGPNCTNVVVGVIDSGALLTHEDLRSNVWFNPGEIIGNGIDDDQNGLIDDVNGWNFVGNNNDVSTTETSHGTSVTGLAAGVGGNALGSSSICQGAKFISVKAIDPETNETTVASMVAAIDYLTDLKKAGVKLAAVNNSWTGAGYSALLEEALQRANAANVLHVFAAGNGGVNIGQSPTYPASYKLPNTITVTGINKLGQLARGANFGSTVDLAAPGEDVIAPDGMNSSSYDFKTGTSFAAPFVTSAAALYVFQYPTARPADIKRAILGAVRANPALNGVVASGGQLDVTTLFALPPQPEEPGPTPGDPGTNPPPTDPGTGTNDPDAGPPETGGPTTPTDPTNPDTGGGTGGGNGDTGTPVDPTNPGTGDGSGGTTNPPPTDPGTGGGGTGNPGDGGTPPEEPPVEEPPISEPEPEEPTPTNPIGSTLDNILDLTTPIFEAPVVKDPIKTVDEKIKDVKDIVKKIKDKSDRTRLSLLDLIIKVVKETAKTTGAVVNEVKNVAGAATEKKILEKAVGGVNEVKKGAIDVVGFIAEQPKPSIPQLGSPTAPRLPAIGVGGRVEVSVQAGVQVKKEQPKTEKPKTESPKPQEPKPQEPKPQEPKPQDPKPQDPKPENPKKPEDNPKSDSSSKPKDNKDKEDGKCEAPGKMGNTDGNPGKNENSCANQKRN